MVQITAAQSLRFIVQGGKVTAQTGQPVRVIEVAINNAAAEALAVRAAAGNLVVRITDARKVSDRVHSMARRLFPSIGYKIRPYTFRHALAAGERKRGRSVDSLAKVWGMCRAGRSAHTGRRSKSGIFPATSWRPTPSDRCATQTFHGGPKLRQHLKKQELHRPD
jgi:hypothetical protein